MYTKKRLPKGTPSNPSPSLHTPHYYLTSLINEVKASQHLSISHMILLLLFLMNYSIY